MSPIKAPKMLPGAIFYLGLLRNYFLIGCKQTIPEKRTRGPAFPKIITTRRECSDKIPKRIEKDLLLEMDSEEQIETIESRQQRLASVPRAVIPQ